MAELRDTLSSFETAKSILTKMLLRRTHDGFSSLKLIRMAELTGFEPAISCVTGRHVRPLHHSSKRHYRYRDINWLRGQDLNLRPSGYEPDELPNCSTPRHYKGLLVWGPRKVIGITYEACASLFEDKSWWRLRGSNPRPSACKADALPAELSLRLD